jgi:hypothetical protein
MGSRTGRGLGACTGINAPGFGWAGMAGYGRGGGFGFGYRGGRGGFVSGRGGFGGGCRWWGAPSDYTAYYPDSRESLQEHAAFLENELAAVKRRMNEQDKDAE